MKEVMPLEGWYIGNDDNIILLPGQSIPLTGGDWTSPQIGFDKPIKYRR